MYLLLWKVEKTEEADHLRLFVQQLPWVVSADHLGHVVDLPTYVKYNGQKNILRI